MLDKTCLSDLRQRLDAHDGLWSIVTQLEPKARRGESITPDTVQRIRAAVGELSDAVDAAIDLATESTPVR